MCSSLTVEVSFPLLVPRKPRSVPKITSGTPCPVNAASSPTSCHFSQLLLRLPGWFYLPWLGQGGGSGKRGFLEQC